VHVIRPRNVFETPFLPPPQKTPPSSIVCLVPILALKSPPISCSAPASSASGRSLLRTHGTREDAVPPLGGAGDGWRPSKSGFERAGEKTRPSYLVCAVVLGANGGAGCSRALAPEGERPMDAIAHEFRDGKRPRRYSMLGIGSETRVEESRWVSGLPHCAWASRHPFKLPIAIPKDPSPNWTRRQVLSWCSHVF
jgi:hypothetical protein